MPPFRRRNTVVDEIADELKAKILTGEIKPGQFLEPQKVLADKYGVGLSTVRESLQALETVGLVTSHPGKGTWVRQDALEKIFNPTEVKTRLGQLNAQQVYEARSVIEVGLTRFAAERAAPEDIQNIWSALHKMEKYRSDKDQFVQADLEFHLAVAKAGHNQLLEQFYYLVRDLLSEVITELVGLPNVVEESIDLQKNIIQAIETRDVPRALAAAQRHMEYIEHLVKTYG